MDNEYGTATITPDVFPAGRRGRWDILYTAGPHGIRQGGSLRLFGPRMGYDIWTLGKVLAFCDNSAIQLEVRTENTDPPSYHYSHRPAATITVYGNDLAPGETIRIVLGGLGGYISGRFIQARAPTYSMTAPFNLLVDCKGLGQFNRESHRAHAYQPCAGSLDVRIEPAAPARIRLSVRNQPKEGDPLKGVAAVEDAFANPVVESAFALRLFAEQGDAAAPEQCTKPAGAEGVHFPMQPPSDGVAYLAASEWRHGLYGISNPIAPNFFEAGRRAYFGDMHVMTGSSGIRSMTGTTEEALRYARGVFGLDFTAVTNSFTEENWPSDAALFKKYNSDHEFVTLPALEAGFATGHKIVYFARDDEPAVNAASLADLWASLEDRECTVIAHHTNTHAETDPDTSWGVHDLSTINPAFERHIEITQSRGSFERDAIGEEVSFGGFGASVRDALARGLRLGFVGGTDTHRARPGSPWSNLSGLDARAHVTGGITAVLCPELTRAAIWGALLARRCYATTSVRILLDFNVNNHPMGNDVDLRTAPRAHYAERLIRVKVAGTGPLDRVVIVRNGNEIHTANVTEMAAEISWQDTTPLDRVCNDTIRGVYYYAKVYQQDGNMAWASPVWLTTR